MKTMIELQAEYDRAMRLRDWLLAGQIMEMMGHVRNA